MEEEDIIHRQLIEEHDRLISRLEDPRCRKPQYFLERVPAFWRPLPELKPPSDPGVLRYWTWNPRWDFRISPTERDVETIGKFLRSRNALHQNLSAIALKFAVPQVNRAIEMLERTRTPADTVLNRKISAAIQFLTETDVNAEEWGTSRAGKHLF